MKLRNIITSFLAGLFIVAGCQQPQEFDVLDGLKVSESVVSLPQDGGTVKVTVSSDAPWEVSASSRWITVSPMSGNAGDTEVSFSVLKTKKERSGEVTITSGDKEQHLEFIQAYKAEGQSGPREFVKVDKVQGNKLYLFVFQIDGKPHVMKGVSTSGASGGYNYGYGEPQALTSSEISADGSKVTLTHQDYSYLVRTSGDGYTIQHLSNNIYLGNNAGYSSISHGDDAVPGSNWKFEFLADGTVKIKTGSMWMHYSSKYGNIELTASDPAGDIPVIYEDTQDPDLPEMTWNPVMVADVTTTAASFEASYSYNGIEPLDGAGFIVKTESDKVAKENQEIDIKVEFDGESRFSATTDKLVAGVTYTVTSYLKYEGITSKSEPVEFTTKTTEPKTIKVAEFVEILKEMEIEGNVSLSAVPVDYVEGIVTAVNGDGQNLYKGLTLEDGTGKPNTGIFFYASEYNNAFEPGTKVRLALADAVASEYNGLIQVVDGDLTEVSKDNEYTLASFSADTVDFADYVGMYVTVVDAKCTSEKGTMWNDGESSNAYVDFTSKDGKVEFSVKTYKTSPWAKQIVGVKSTGNISGVVQVSKDEYSLLPNKSADVAAFANTDPEIKTVSKTSVTWENYDVNPVEIEVTGERLAGITAGLDSDHWTVAVSGTKISVKPNTMNKADAPVKAVLTVAAMGGNSVEVALTHEGAVAFKAGKYWLAVENIVAAPLAESKTYGYLPIADAVVTDEVVASVAANAFTFAEVEGGYTIQDSFGRYLYQSGTFNNFNVSATLPESGYVWSVEMVEGGAYKIMNVEKEKWIQYDETYGSFGSYADARGVIPFLVDASNPIEEGGDEGEVDGTVASKTFSELGYENAESVDGKEIKLDDNVTIVFAKGNASTAPAYYDSGSAIRMYQNGATLDVKAAGKTITSIELTFANNHYYVAADSGELSAEAAVRTWTGEASAVKFTSTGTDKNHRAYVSAIKVIYK